MSLVKPASNRGLPGPESWGTLECGLTLSWTRVCFQQVSPLLVGGSQDSGRIGAELLKSLAFLQTFTNSFISLTRSFNEHPTLPPCRSVGMEAKIIEEALRLVNTLLPHRAAVLGVGRVRKASRKRRLLSCLDSRSTPGAEKGKGPSRGWNSSRPCMIILE